MLRLYEKVDNPRLLESARQGLSREFIKSRVGGSMTARVNGFMAEFAVANLIRLLHRQHPQVELYYPLDSEDMFGGADWWVYLRRSARLERNLAIALQVKSDIAQPGNYQELFTHPVRSLIANDDQGQAKSITAVTAGLNQMLQRRLDSRSLENTVATSQHYSNVWPALFTIARLPDRSLIDIHSGRFLDGQYEKNAASDLGLVLSRLDKRNGIDNEAKG